VVIYNAEGKGKFGNPSLRTMALAILPELQAEVHSSMQALQVKHDEVRGHFVRMRVTHRGEHLPLRVVMEYRAADRISRWRCWANRHAARA
jgi:hypothetical protein